MISKIYFYGLKKILLRRIISSFLKEIQSKYFEKNGHILNVFLFHKDTLFNILVLFKYAEIKLGCTWSLVCNEFNTPALDSQFSNKTKKISIHSN